MPGFAASRLVKRRARGVTGQNQDLNNSYGDFVGRASAADRNEQVRDSGRTNVLGRKTS